jgi:beta-mannosidase
VVDHTGRAKVALHHLRRAFAPVAVWLTDEGLNGLAVHVANARPTPLRARLRVGLFQDGERPVADGTEELVVPPHTTVQRGVDALVGRFVDSGWAFRFGPPPHDVVVAGLEPEGAGTADDPAATPPGLLAVAFPAGRPTGRRGADELGLQAMLVTTEDGDPAVHLRSRAFVHGVRLEVPGWLPADDAFPLAPGGPRTVLLRPDPFSTDSTPASPPSGGLRALNLRGRVPIRPRPS